MKIPNKREFQEITFLVIDTTLASDISESFRKNIKVNHDS